MKPIPICLCAFAPLRDNSVAVCALRYAVLTLVIATLSRSAFAESPLAVPVTGEPFRAELMAVNPDGQLIFRDGQKQRSLPMADLVCWGQCVEQGRGAAIVLADGSLLAAEVVMADNERLTIESDTVGTLILPLESLSGIVFRPPSNRLDCDRLLDSISPRPSDGRGAGGEGSLSPLAASQNLTSLAPHSPASKDESDHLLVDNGDELAGQVLGIADDTVKLETDAGPIDVKTDRVVALVFNPALKRKPATKPGQLQTWVGLSDGSRLLATQFLLQADSAQLTVVGQPLAVSQRDLVFLQPLGGRIVYLSDLKPTDYHQTPFVGQPSDGPVLTWPYQPDRSAVGGLLRSAGRLYLKGLGLHSAARLEYQLSPLLLDGPGSRKNSPRPSDGRGAGGEGGLSFLGPPTHFAAELALDDSTNNQGSVQFRILLDGQERFVSPIVRSGQPPLPVSLDVTGAKKLELIVDYADRADVLDHANWLNARLTR